jgi:hypothetical protein
MLMVQSHGQIFLAGGRRKASLELYKDDRTTRIGPLVNNIRIDLAQTPRVNIKASAKCLQELRISSMSFWLDNKNLGTDNTAPYWMIDGAWTPMIGNHTIMTKAYRRNNAKGRLMLKTTVSVIVIDSRTKSPKAAPSKAPAQADKAVPTMVPVSAQVPALTPFAPPTKAPTRNPTKAPMRHPTKAPTRHPTKAPMRPPTKAPTKPPTRSRPKLLLRPRLNATLAPSRTLIA